MTALTLTLIVAPTAFGASSCTRGTATANAASGNCSTGGGGGGGAPAQSPCILDLQFPYPANDTMLASVSATCTIPVASYTLVLSILQRPTGSSDASYVVENTKSKTQITAPSITLSAECIAGDYEATATLDIVADDGSPQPPATVTQAQPGITNADCTSPN